MITVNNKLQAWFAIIIAAWSLIIMPVLPAYASFIFLPELNVNSTSKEKTAHSENRNKDQDDGTAAALASGATSLASMAAGGITESQMTDMAKSRAMGMLSGAASSEAQGWFAGLGNARVKVNIDQNFSLKGSEFDLLMPLYDSGENLWFTQHSIHRTDNRLQMNNGTGIRHFGDKWMTGVNAFVDYDISRGHTRAGVGAELWRDNLKLSANGYFRLSSWRSAPELHDDYLARPANGWDVQAQGWLPAYPQLGGSLGVQKYYGKEVALVSADDRHANPVAVTAGLSLTPVPLLTFTADHSMGSGSISESHFGLQINVTPSMTLAQQLDPSAVGGMRTLAGSRLDLVERNNDIVLDYKKKELIKLSLYTHTEGHAGGEYPLVQALKTKYALKDIEWNADAFLAAGGKISGSGTATRITLPAYRPVTDARLAMQSNTYIISGSAWDMKGNASTPQRAEVVVLAEEFSEANSSLTASPVTLDADGTTPSAIVLTLKDSNKKPVSGQDVAFTVTGVDGVTLTKVKDNGDGTYTASLTGKHAGVATVTASVGGTALKTLNATVTLVAGDPDGGKSTFSVSPKSIVADGNATATLTLAEKDASGNPVTGVASLVTFSLKDSDGHAPAPGRISLSDVKESSTKGTYTATMKGTQAGTWTIVPQHSGRALGTLSDTETLTAGSADETQSALSATPASIVADGTTASTLTLLLKDKSGTVLPKQAVTFSVSGVDSTTLSPVKDNGDGTYTASLTGTRAGTATITATAGGSTLASLKTTVTLTAGDAVQANSTLTAAPATISVNDTPSIITLTLKDANNNPVAGQNVILTETGVAGTTLSAVKDNQDGTYTAELSGSVAGKAIVAASLNGTPLDKLSASVTLTAGAPDSGKSAFSASPASIAANDTATSTLTFTAKDASGNAVTGIAASLTFSVKDSKGAAPEAGKTTVSAVSESSTAGTYTATLKGTRADTYTVVPQYNGTAVGSLSAPVTLTAGAPSETQSTLTAAPQSIEADGTTKSVLTLTLKDAHDNLLTGQTVTLAVTGVKNTTVTIPTDNGDGTYTAELTGTDTGTATVIPSVGGTALSGLKAEITLTTGDVSAPDSSLSAAPASITADGTSKSVLTLTLKDKNSHPVTGQTVTFPVTGVQHTTVSTPTDNGDGTYTAELTGTSAGTASIGVTVGGTAVAITPATVTLTAGDPDATQSTFAASPKKIAADGTAQSTLTLVAADLHGNAVTGMADKLTLGVKNAQGAAPAAADLTVSALAEGSTAGTYTATLKGTLAGSYTLTPQFSGAAMGTLSDTVELSAGSPSEATSTLAATPASITADGTDKSTLVLTLKDLKGNALTGVDVVFSASGAKNTTVSTPNDNGDGTYTAELTGTSAGKATVTATADGVALSSLTADVILNAGEPVETHSSMKAEPASITADGTDKSVITLTLKDANDNAVTGQHVTLAVTGAKNTTVSMPNDNGDGTYTAELTGTAAGRATVTPSVDGTALSKLKADVTLTAGSPSDSHSSLKAVPATITANGTDKSVITLTLKDVNDNPVSGQDVSFSVSGADNTSISTVTDNGDGTYSAELTGTTAGTATIAALLNGTAMAGVDTTVILNADGTTAQVSALSVESDNAVADGTSANTVKVTVTDKTGNPLEGQVISFTADNGATVAATGTTLADGTVTQTVTSTVAGTSSITASISNSTQSADVHFKAGKPSETQSTLTAAPQSIEADGTTKSVLILTLKDAHDNLLSGQTVTLAVTGVKNTTLTTTKDNGDGTYTAELTGTDTGTATVIPSVGGTALSGLKAEITLTTGDVSAPDSSLSAAPASITADGTSKSVLTLTLKDKNSHPVTGQTVTFPVTGVQHTTVSTPTDNGDGTYTAELTGTSAGTASIGVSVGGTAVAITPASVTLTAGDASATKSTLVAKPASITADGSDKSTVTLSLKDTNGNPVTGQSVTFPVTGVDNTTVSTPKDNGDGTYTAELTGTTAGTASIGVTVGGTALAITPVTVTLTAGDASATESTLVATPASITADGSDKSTVTLSLKDTNGNPVTGQTVTFPVTGVQPTTVSTPKDNGDGTYTAKLTGKAAGIASIGVNLKNSELAVTPAQVELVAGAPDAYQSSFVVSPNKIAADGTEESTLTFTAKDQNNNVITGMADKITFSVYSDDGKDDAVTVSSTAEGSTKGVYTATLKGTRPGTYNVWPKFSGSQVGRLHQTVMLVVGAPDQSKSTFTASPKEIIATNQFMDGDTSSTLTLTLQDAGGNAVTGVAGKVSLSVKRDGTDVDAGKLVSQVTEGRKGTYTAKFSLPDTLTAQPGSYSFALKYDGKPVDGLTDSVTLKPSEPIITYPGSDVNFSTLKAEPDTIKADGRTAATLTLTAIDRWGNKVIGVTKGIDLAVNYTTSPLSQFGLTASAWHDNNDGTYTSTVTGTLAKGRMSLSIQSGSDNTQAYLTVDPADLDGTQSSFAASPKTITADGTSESTLTFTAKDLNGNAITGIAGKVTFSVKDSHGSAPADGTVTVSSAAESSTKGVYTATLKGTLAGTYIVSPQFSGSPVGTLSDTVILESGEVSSTTSSLALSPDTIIIGDPDNNTSHVTMTLKDANGNPVSGLQGDIKLAVSGSLGLSGITAANEPGTYEAILRGGGQMGDETLTMSIDGQSATLSADIHILAVASDTLTTLTVDKNSVTADGTDVATLTLSVEAAGNIPVAGETVSLKTDGAVASPNVVISEPVDNGDGTYTIKVSNTDVQALKFIATFKDGKNDTVSHSISLADEISFVPGKPDMTKSSLSLDKTTIVSGGETLTATLDLKDSLEHPISGAAVDFIAGTTWPEYGGTEPMHFTNQTDHGDGTYSVDVAVMISNGVDTTRTKLVARPHDSDFIGEQLIGPFAVTAPKETSKAAQLGTLTNPYKFAANSGFPTTAFEGAELAVYPDVGQLSDYYVSIYSTKTHKTPTWANVDKATGLVKFTNNPGTDQLRIYLEPKDGGVPIDITLPKISKWYFLVSNGDGNPGLTFSQYHAKCGGAGYSEPDLFKDLVDGPSDEEPQSWGKLPTKVARNVGKVTGEWGSIGSQFPKVTDDKGRIGYDAWTSTIAVPGHAMFKLSTPVPTSNTAQWAHSDDSISDDAASANIGLCYKQN